MRRSDDDAVVGEVERHGRGAAVFQVKGLLRVSAWLVDTRKVDRTSDREIALFSRAVRVSQDVRSRQRNGIDLIARRHWTRGAAQSPIVVRKNRIEDIYSFIFLNSAYESF